MSSKEKQGQGQGQGQGLPRQRKEGGQGGGGQGGGRGKERISFQGKDAFPKEPASRTVKLAVPPENGGTEQRGKVETEPLFYGIISTIKQGFGFIQPLLEDEQIFMSARELYLDVKIGDRVGFFVRPSPRGLAAEGVHKIAPNLEKVVENVKGTVNRGTDRHRSGVGTITIDLSAEVDILMPIKEVVFMPADVIPRSVPKNHRLDKGDYVQFSIFRVTGSTLYVAASISFLQLKRDRAVALQIQRMLDAGVVRELGIVSALKNYEYGFLKALDRKDEIYFRMEDGSHTEGEEDKLSEVCCYVVMLLCCYVVCSMHTVWSFFFTLSYIHTIHSYTSYPSIPSTPSIPSIPPIPPIAGLRSGVLRDHRDGQGEDERQSHTREDCAQRYGEVRIGRSGWCGGVCDRGERLSPRGDTGYRPIECVFVY
jgi:cold shock CspA family protein